MTLVTGLHQKKHFRPVVMIPDRGPLFDCLNNAGIQTIVWPYQHWIGRNRINRIILGPVRMLLNVISLMALHKKIGKMKPSIIYTNSLAQPFGALIALRYKIPHIWHAREFIHEDIYRDYDFGTKRSMALVGKSVKVICITRAIENKMKRFIAESKLKVIYNGFVFAAQPNDDLKTKYDQVVQKSQPVSLLIVGQLHAGKGHADAIRALSVLDARGYNVCLSIVGSGKEQYVASLKELAKDLSIENKIKWHGFVNKPENYYNGIAVALVCSRCEAFGRVVVEMMAAGIPVAATNSGGVPEIIEDGITGLLYRPGDCEALASNIEKLLKEKELYLSIATQGRRSVYERFAADQYVSGVCEVLEEVSKT